MARDAVERSVVTIQHKPGPACMIELIAFGNSKGVFRVAACAAGLTRGDHRGSGIVKKPQVRVRMATCAAAAFAEELSHESEAAPIFIGNRTGTMASLTIEFLVRTEQWVLGPESMIKVIITYSGKSIFGMAASAAAAPEPLTRHVTSVECTAVHILMAGGALGRRFPKQVGHAPKSSAHAVGFQGALVASLAIARGMLTKQLEARCRAMLKVIAQQVSKQRGLMAIRTILGFDHASVRVLVTRDTGGLGADQHRRIALTA